MGVFVVLVACFPPILYGENRGLLCSKLELDVQFWPHGMRSDVEFFFLSIGYKAKLTGCPTSFKRIHVSICVKKTTTSLSQAVMDRRDSD